MPTRRGALLDRAEAIEGAGHPPGSTCPVCASEAVRPWRPATASSGSSARHRSYPLARCDECGSAATGGADAEGPELYRQGTYASGSGRLESALAPLRRLVSWDRRRVLGPVPAGSRVLEIGTGKGRLAEDLAAAGCEVIAIEPAVEAAAAARARGVEVRPVPVEQASFEAGEFDRVILWHVLEHLGDAAAALRRIRPWIGPGGSLVVAVPNLSSLQAALGGDRWFHQDVPRHRTHLTSSGVRALLARAGYSPARTRHLLLEHNFLGMWLTLLNRLTAARDVPFRFLKRDLRYSRRADAVRDTLVVALAGPLLVPVSIVLELAAAMAGRGGTIVIEADTGPEARVARP